MQWTDDGIVLGVKRYGESSVILELMTHERGRHLGLARGGGLGRAVRPLFSRGGGFGSGLESRRRHWNNGRPDLRVAALGPRRVARRRRRLPRQAPGLAGVLA